MFAFSMCYDFIVFVSSQNCMLKKTIHLHLLQSHATTRTNAAVPKPTLFLLRTLPNRHFGLHTRPYHSNNTNALLVLPQIASNIYQLLSPGMSDNLKH